VKNLLPIHRNLLRPAACLLTLSVLMLLTDGCDYARMTDDEAINTYGEKIPTMPAHTVPIADGIESLRIADPATLVNPVPFDADSIAGGQTAYDYYCVHCHGPKGDGNGTVGQSFSPLPTDLGSSPVQQQSDGELFIKISLGYKRHPPLAYTVAEQDRWAVINYLRSLKPLQEAVLP
jgi:mono/diheme cytochrome c family protein